METKEIKPQTGVPSIWKGKWEFIKDRRFITSALLLPSFKYASAKRIY